MLVHGGKLLAAANNWDISVDQWIDISTGISPFAYPVPHIPESCWHRLPEDEDQLLDSAAAYYGVPHDYLMPLSGSQAAIQTLPSMFARCRVAFLTPSYNEHVHAWRTWRHEVHEFFEPEALVSMSSKFDVIVLANPNNPTGLKWHRDSLIALSENLNKGGTLIIDEAFIDCTPADSVIDLVATRNMIVLRSLGKFFGLAGARVGFMAANREVLLALRERLGPWAISGASRFVAMKALSDRVWQNEQRSRLALLSSEMRRTLETCGLQTSGHTPYFNWVRCDEALEIHKQLCSHAILSRLFEQPLSLRFGLPRNMSDISRIEWALKSPTKLNPR